MRSEIAAVEAVENGFDRAIVVGRTFSVGRGWRGIRKRGQKRVLLSLVEAYAFERVGDFAVRTDKHEVGVPSHHFGVQRKGTRITELVVSADFYLKNPLVRQSGNRSDRSARNAFSQMH